MIPNKEPRYTLKVKGLGRGEGKAQNSCCRKCPGDSAGAGSDMSELLPEPGRGLGARAAAGSLVWFHRSPQECTADQKQEPGKQTVESRCLSRTGRVRMTGTKSSDCRIAVSAALKWLTVGGRPDRGDSGRPSQSDGREEEGGLG